jgi:uncharacterized protein YbcI
VSEQPPPATVERSPQSTICAGISALVRERWGRGPSRSRAYWAGRDALVVLLDDAHTEAELTLIEAGHGAEVVAGRRRLSEIAEADLRRIAASAIGREVEAVLSQTGLEPAITVHTFVFVPVARTPDRGEQLGEHLRRAFEQSDSARALLAEGVQARRHAQERRAARRAEESG